MSKHVETKTCLNNPEIKQENRKYFAVHKNENTLCQNLYVTKAVLRG